MLQQAADVFGFGDAARGSYTRDDGAEVTHENFIERMGNKLCGSCFGILLFFASLYLVWWNEGETVRNSQLLFEVTEAAIDVKCTDEPGPNSGKLVFISCDIDQSSLTTFKETPGLANGVPALSITSSVEKYQWKEISTKKTGKSSAGGKSTTTTYSYRKEWSSTLYEGSYKNANYATAAPPGQKQNPRNGMCGYTAIRKKSTNVALEGNGKWKLDNVLDKLITAAGSSKVDVSQGGGVPTPPEQCGVVNTWNDNLSGSTNQGSAPASMDKACCDEKYYCKSTPKGSSSPMVGDCRVSYTKKTATTASVMGVANEQGQFAKFKSEKYPQQTLLRVWAKPLTKDAAIEIIKEGFEAQSFLLRVLGFLMCWLGSQMFFGPLVLVPQLIPFCGDFISGLFGCLLCCATCLCSSFWWFLVFALAWLRFRPMIGGPLLAVSLVSGAALVAWRVTEKNKRDALNADKEGAASGGEAPAGDIAMAEPAANDYPAPGGDAGGYPAPGGGGYPAPGGGYPAPG